MANTIKDFTLSSLAEMELRELYHALEDRGDKLESIRLIYGDASDEYSDASNDLRVILGLKQWMKDYFNTLGDESLLFVYPDPIVLYSGPENLHPDVDKTNTPFAFLKPKPEDYVAEQHDEVKHGKVED